MAGADAVQVGTATFRDPRAPWRVLAELERWCERHDVATCASSWGRSMAETVPRPSAGRARCAERAVVPGIDPTRGQARALGTRRLRPRAPAEFGSRYLEAFAGVVAVVKPNVAFFEQYGAAGLATLEALLAAAREAGVLTIADAKRGDIASTNAAYARAWLAPTARSPADAIDRVAVPRARRAHARSSTPPQRNGRGVFVVVRSTNPEGRADAERPRVADGRSTSRSRCSTWSWSARPLSVGAVIGLMAGARAPRAARKRGFYLAPGVGDPGGRPRPIWPRSSGVWHRTTVVVNLSRSLLAPDPIAHALLEAAEHAQEEISPGLRPRFVAEALWSGHAATACTHR